MKDLTDADIGRLVSRWLQDALTVSDEARAISGPYTREIQEEELSALQKYEADFRSALGSRNYDIVVGAAEGLLSDEGMEPDRNNPSFKRLIRELTKAGLRHALIEQQRAQGQFDGDLPVAESTNSTPSSGSFGSGSNFPMPSNTQEAGGDAPPSEPVSAVFDAFERDMMKGRRWTEKTRTENRAMVMTMVEVLGDIPIAIFDKPLVRTYKEKLESYPRNRHKDPRYRAKSLAQIAQMASVDTVSVTTVNNHLTKIAGFFTWAVDKGYAATNPFKRMTTPTGARAKDDVLPFDQADLAAIFATPLYTGNARRKPWQFWLPLLGLFTGARIEELCQLHLEDLRQVNGVWVFDINRKPGRNLKNKASQRLIPIHPELERIGLLEYADALRRSRKTRLFPELNPVGSKTSHYASIWFGKLKRDLGMPSRTKVYHSFRHRMTDALRGASAPDYVIKRVLGHEVGSITHDVYGSDEQLVQPMLEVLRRVDFGVDLSHITWSRPQSSAFPK